MTTPDNDAKAKEQHDADALKHALARIQGLGVRMPPEPSKAPPDREKMNRQRDQSDGD